MYKAIIFFILFIGIIFVIISIVQTNTTNETDQSNVETFEGNKNSKSQNNEIQYRYIPRTFDEDQLQPVYVSDIFDTMFSQPSPWLLSIREYDQRKQQRINQYFITQM